MIILANLYNTETGVYSTKKFNSVQEFNEFDFTCVYDFLETFDTKRKPEKQSAKDYLRQFAIAFQSTFSYDIYEVWTYSELAEIYSYFEKYARRYGLIREFRENGII